MKRRLDLLVFSLYLAILCQFALACLSVKDGRVSLSLYNIFYSCLILFSLLNRKQIRRKCLLAIFSLFPILSFAIWGSITIQVTVWGFCLLFLLIGLGLFFWLDFDALF